MNGKTAKRLRKIAKESTASYELIKKGYNSFDKHARALAKLAIKVSNEDNRLQNTGMDRESENQDQQRAAV